MTRFLFGQMGNGPEYYEKAMDSLMRPLNISHRPRIGHGQHAYGKQVGRLPLSRAGSRSAAEGSQPSYWEPGMSYTTEGKNNGKAPSFERNIGRVDLHLSGMRGAPPGPTLAADYAGGSTRPQSAIAMLRSAADSVPSSFGNKRQAHGDRPIPEIAKKHVYTLAWDKSSTRDQWAAQPLRIQG